MFRTDPMVLCEMYLQPEAAFASLSKLGDMGLVQILDMNTEVAPFKKKYVAELCRCASMERKMRHIEHEIIHDKLEIPDPKTEPEAMLFHDMVKVESMIEKWDADISQISMNQSNLKQDLLEMKEMKYVLNNIGPMLGSAEIGLQKFLAQYRHGEDFPPGGRLYVMSGVVKRTRSYPFQLMLWRVSRGNIFYRQAKEDEVLEDPYTGGEIRKVAFLAFCQGELLASHMQKIFTGFRVNIYPCPETDEERFIVFNKVDDRVQELEDVLRKAKYFRCKSLRLVSRKWKSAMIQIRKAKAVYHNLNLFTLDITKNCLIGQCWVPIKDLKIIQETLRVISEKMESNVDSFLNIVQTDAEPPTKHRTNMFTYGFQMLINAYGDSKYGEVNPGLFTIISFPFLFAIMFGDCGHAMIMVIFALWLIIYESHFLKQQGSEIWNIFFGGRYVILLLGMFSLITGFIYNDVFSRAMNFTGSMWGNAYSSNDLANHSLFDIDFKSRLRRPYVLGIDPVWTISRNKIMIENSIKMKMSLIIGIIHMLFGIIVSIFNHIHFKDYHRVLLQFIPEFTFLLCIFFWLVILIFYKWIYFYNGHANLRYTCGCAPQILILFIDMVLYGSTDTKISDANCKVYLFDAQATVQPVLVTIALIMVPILLFGIPVYIAILNKKRRKKILININTSLMHSNISQRQHYMSSIVGHRTDKEHFTTAKSFSVNDITKFRKYQPTDAGEEALIAKLALYNTPFAEMMINQAVHTIEFVLSTISHTASYLRLWALSLAHSQLSEMLWVMVLSKLSLQEHTGLGVVKMFIVFPIWIFFTLSILVVMEGLSAFLHTLRLHWVEFMSKFFIGGGTAFKPFSFQEILAADVKADPVCAAKARRRDKLTMEDVHFSKV